MGLYIKDLEMPECCTTCIFCDHDVECCKRSWRRVAVDGRREDCPIMEVPAHNRLVDDKVVYATLTKYYHHCL